MLGSTDHKVEKIFTGTLWVQMKTGGDYSKYVNKIIFYNIKQDVYLDVSINTKTEKYLKDYIPGGSAVIHGTIDMWRENFGERKGFGWMENTIQQLNYYLTFTTFYSQLDRGGKTQLCDWGYERYQYQIY